IGRAAAIVRADFAGRPGLGASRRAENLSTGDPSMFISPAYAQSGDLFSNPMGNFLPIVGIFVLMYFLILRPQQGRVKQHQEMVKSLRRGDTVISQGGIVGKVTKLVDDDQIEVEIADGVRVRQMRSMVSDVRARGEPVRDEAAKG